MFGDSAYGKLLVAVLVSTMCWVFCPVPATAFNTHRPRTGATSSSLLGTFCQSTQNLRTRLANKLPELRETVEDNMTDNDRSRAASVHTTNTFSSDKRLSNLIKDLDTGVNNLRCMGRALDVLCHCLHHRCPRCLNFFPLYQHHVLPDNGRQLRGERAFQRSYHDVFRQFEQLRTSVDDSGKWASDQNCAVWLVDSAYVMALSFATVNSAQTFLDDVNAYCQPPGF